LFSFKLIGSRFEWQDSEEESRAREIMIRKQQTKEKDGFCRRVDYYDGQVLTVDGRLPFFSLSHFFDSWSIQLIH
jgi:hypothetical protein